MMRISAAVAREPGADLDVVELDLEDPRPDELLIRMVGVGVCHTDLLVRDEPGPTQLPLVLGHEGSGVVEKVGAAVQDFDDGDQVILTWNSCGLCRQCLSGKPAHCDQHQLLNLSGHRDDGTTGLSEAGRPIGGRFFSQSSFASHALSRARNTVKLSADLALAQLRVLGPLGCGVQTGAGAFLTAFDVRSGSAVAVWGTGGVGLSAVMAAATRHCDPIVAIDTNPGRLELAHALGATHTVNAASDDVREQVVAISNGGVDYAIDTTGLAPVVANAARALAIGGRLGLHGRARLIPGGMDLAQVPPGRIVTFLIEGECVPQLFIPEMLDLYQRGRFPFDQMIRTYPFDQINKAIDDMQSGSVVKPVLTF
jgi:aryl-alcohol dehydrogenase